METTIDQIANMFMSEGHTIFGGYVRDKLLGEPPNDLDVIVHECVRPETMVYELARRGSVQIVEIKKGYGFDDLDESFTHTRILFNDIQVDLVQGKHHKPDCDVNKLTLNNYYKTNLGVLPGSGVKLLEVVQHIFNRVFVPDIGMSEERKQKMVEKGFTCLSYLEYNL